MTNKPIANTRALGAFDFSQTPSTNGRTMPLRIGFCSLLMETAALPELWRPNAFVDVGRGLDIRDVFGPYTTSRAHVASVRTNRSK